MDLSARYTQEHGTVYLTGIQALVRLPMDQMRRDRFSGLSTGTFISGYEGSPLAGYDMTLMRTKSLLTPLQIHFLPGVNEDLAATAVMGSQIYQVLGKGKVDGVLGIWYGKGPGVDRTGDVFRHANMIGCAGNNAALVLAGDDHAAKSSTIPHQSDLSLYNAGIPILYPGSVQEVLDYGLLAIAMSRHSGAWVGLKMITNVCDGGGTVTVDSDRLAIRTPEGYRKMTDPRLTPPVTLALEYEVHERRLAAVQEFALLNKVNRWEGAHHLAQLGIATSGKSYYDLMQALRDMGVRAGDLTRLGIRVAKFGLTFPMETGFLREFAAGLRTLLVVEEKRSFLEFQIRDALYAQADRPAVLGKIDAEGHPLLPSTGELDPDIIARVVARLLPREVADGASDRLRRLDEIAARPRETGTARSPTFCSGCPHNRSTLLLEGQVAGGGIGCHSMALSLADVNRGFEFMTQMGGEGAAWLGMEPFVERGHIFQNIGDGTYFHSGMLAVQACVAAGVNITYKLLFNGHVAMTGGQTVAGALAIPELTKKLQAEGVKRTIVLAEEAGRYRDAALATNAEVRDRSELARTLTELEKVAGVTVLIYDQQCAAEKRRMRSRGKLAEPVERLVIHEEVCEGCGDCVTQSNCVSLQPVQTMLGEKMRIHQSSCNKDYSCALGDCPSFLTVHIKEGTGLARPPLPSLPDMEVPRPAPVVTAEDGYRIVMPGIGGTGVVTVNALLATAALIDGKSVATLDQTGLAQKGGAVVSHIVISDRPIAVSSKVNAGNADLLLGFDLLGAASAENLKSAHPAQTVAVVNSEVTPTAETVRKRLVIAGPGRLVDRINEATKPGQSLFIDANRVAAGLFGSHLRVNVFLLGAAYQAGYIPVSEEALGEAIALNKVDADQNLKAFQWGRKYYLDASWVEEQCAPKTSRPQAIGDFAYRRAELKRYQNEAYARSYEEFVRSVEARVPELAAIVERYLYKLMAYKDEYEVARLLTKPEFEASARAIWESAESISYNLHPPLLRKLGIRKKIQLGGWARAPLRGLAACKILRGTPLDVFGLTSHRREERELNGWYRALIESVIANYAPGKHALAMEIAALPDQIRGYERIKADSIRKVKQAAEEKLLELRMGVSVTAIG